MPTTPAISVIIPCYNSGEFLPDAIASIEEYRDDSKYEIIIIDDGSTEKTTIDVLDTLKAKGYQIHAQENKGVGAARNVGASRARAGFLIFLDSDNKIRPNYIDRGIEKLNADPHAGVVYGKLNWIGDFTEDRFFEIRAFDKYDLLAGNYIDTCAVVRRSAWASVGGFDENRAIMGHADWDLWIRIADKGWTFCYVDEILFDYRVRKDSLVASVKHSAAQQYVYHKNFEIVKRSYDYLEAQHRFYKYDQAHPFRSFFKYLYYKIKKPLAK